MPFSRDRIIRVALSLWVVGIFGWWAAITFVINMLDQPGFSIDFLAFWAAGKLAVSGDGMLVWDTKAFNLAQGVDPEARQVLSWFYPPSYHLMVAPFGLLPFSLAFGLWTLLTIGLFWRVMAQVAPSALPLVIISPAIFLTAKLGNNAPLFAACLAYALMQLERPARAGGAIAMLTLKPGLGPMIAVAMVANRQWHVILWVGLMAGGLLLAATGVFGLGYWTEFLAGLDFALARITPEARLTGQMTSWFALMRYLGAEPSTAMLVHGGALALIALVTLVLWSRDSADANFRAAALAVSVTLSSPHAFHYEMVYALVAIVFVVRAGPTTMDKAIIALLWLGPLPGIWPVNLVPVCLYGAPMLSFCFAYLAFRCLQPRPTADP